MPTISAPQFKALQTRVGKLLAGGFINVRALEVEAGLSNGSVKRLLASDPEAWVQHANSNHHTPPALHKAMDRVVLSVAEAYRPGEDRDKDNGKYPWP